MRTITVPSVVGSLNQVNTLVRGLVLDAMLTRDAAHRLRLATEELFINIVRHGYGPGRPDAQVLVEAGVTDQEVWLRLVDTAPRFDPFRVPDPAGLYLPLPDRVPGALGLYLARHAVDTASHEYTDGANHTTIIVRRARAFGGGKTNGHKRINSERL